MLSFWVFSYSSHITRKSCTNKAKSFGVILCKISLRFNFSKSLMPCNFVRRLSHCTILDCCNKCAVIVYDVFNCTAFVVGLCRLYINFRLPIVVTQLFKKVLTDRNFPICRSSSRIFNCFKEWFAKTSLSVWFSKTGSDNLCTKFGLCW